MRTINIKLLADGVSVSDDRLGRAGEKNVVQLKIDFEEYRSSDYSAAVLIFRPANSPALPMEPMEMPESGPLLVTVPTWAMAAKGTTQIQLSLTGEDVEARSYVWEMRVEQSLLNTGAQPPAVTDWLQAALVRADAAPAIVDAAQGEQITLTDALERPLRGLALYGKITQAATPLPTAPVPLDGVGEGGSIAVTVSGGSAAAKTLNVPVLAPLYGISSASVAGNYTDDDGRSWVCDEIDLAAGLRTDRIGVQILTGEESITLNTSGQFYIDRSERVVGFVECFCSHLLGSPNGAYASGAGAVDNAVSVGSTRTWVRASAYPTKSDFVAFLQEQYAAGTPVTIYYILEAPTQRVLTPAEKADYSALIGHTGSMQISGEDNAGLRVDYAIDTKSYIDKKIAALAAAMINNL